MTDHEEPESSLSVTIPPPLLRYIRIDDTHTETTCRGALFGDGPSRGVYGKISWILTGPHCVPVLVVGRRHRSLGGKGRWMESGEAYTDAAVYKIAYRSPVIRKGWTGVTSPPWRLWAREGSTRLVVPPLPRDVWCALSGEEPHGMMSS